MNFASKANLFSSASVLTAKGFFRLLFPSTNRKKQIKAIIHQLQNISSNGNHARAIDMNICFFLYIGNIFSLVFWLIFHVPRFRKEVRELVELEDLPVADWQKDGYVGLSEIENNRSARILVKDFADELCNLVIKIREFKQHNEPLVIIDFGCGNGYLCREIINRNQFTQIICIGVDSTPANVELINDRFMISHENGELIFKTINELTDSTIALLSRESKETGKSIFAIYHDDFLRLDKLVSPGQIDMIFYSRVLHHLKTGDRHLVEKLCRKLSFLTLELEDFYSRITPLFAALMSTGVDHNNLSFVNGAVLSIIRDPVNDDLHGYVKKLLPNSYARIIPGDFGFNTSDFYLKGADIRELTRGFKWH